MNQCNKCGGNRLNSKGNCNDCHAAYMREWKARNPEKVKACRLRRDPEKVKAERKRDREKNRDKRKKAQKDSVDKNKSHYKTYKKAWYEANKEKSLKQSKEARERRLAKDPEGERRKRAEYQRKRRKQEKWLVHGRMSSLVRQYLKRRRLKKNGIKWEVLTGYTVEELIAHLKTTVPNGYTWQDYLDGVLELDHIQAVNSFEFESVTDSEFARCWSLNNLRLLTREDNLARRYQS